jgi:hypothetical protein
MKNIETPKASLGIEALITDIFNEVLWADMTMHYSQTDGDLIMDNQTGISKGHSRRHLFLDDITLSLCVKPLYKGNFLSRIKSAWQMLTGSLRRTDDMKAVIVCSKMDPCAVNVSLRIKRSENGSVSVDYFTTDAFTKELLKRNISPN